MFMTTFLAYSGGLFDVLKTVATLQVPNFEKYWDNWGGSTNNDHFSSITKNYKENSTERRCFVEGREDEECTFRMNRLLFTRNWNNTQKISSDNINTGHLSIVVS